MVTGLSALGHSLTKSIKQRAWVQSLVFVVAWLGVWFLAYVVEYVNHASVWFPPAGLTFAALLVVGVRIVPALVVCGIISTIWAGFLYHLDRTIPELFIAGMVFSITHIIPYFIATYILKRLANHRVSQLPALVLIFLIVAVISTLVATFSILYGLVFTGLMSYSDIVAAWMPFWVGDMAGVIAMGPVFVAILSRVYPQSQFWIGELRDISDINQSDRFAAKLLICCVLLTAVMLVAYRYTVPETNFAIFVMLIPVMWISYTESPVRIAISVALFSFCVAFLVNLFGLMDHVIVYQFAICIVAASAFFYLSIPSLLANNQILRHRAFTDNLTGVASRDHLVHQAQFEVMKSHTERSSLALIVFDLDNFKSINDALGHVEGDKALTHISQTARLKLRKTDLLGRYGGDEFVILMPDSTLEEAVQKAERIRQEIQKLTFNQSWQLSCSFGVSELYDRDDFITLFKRADKALYKAKREGRNRVCY
ncbi:GGDEF domain-containing protein [Vibrio albus]|uniref:GGDEF domain-containing protein n=1 Tax=Vibrio albus TaxID=2200953 RepID=UPI0015E83750|nr:diguanylate cyclase [Vibrio albus]